MKIRAKDIPIKVKLIAFSGLAVVLTCAIVATGLFYSRQIDQAQQLKEHVNAVLTTLLQVRSAEKSYLQSFSADDQKEYDHLLKSMAGAVQILAHQTQDPVQAKQVSGMEGQFNSYREAIDQIEVLHEKRNRLKVEMPKPLVKAEETLDGILSGLYQEQANLQMEGEDLSDSQRELMVVVKDTLIVLLRVQNIQMRFLSTNERKYVDAFHNIAQGNAKTAIDRLIEFAKALQNEDYIAKSNQVKASLATLIGYIEQSLSLSAQEKTERTTIDDKGHQIVDRCASLVTEADTIIREARRSAVLSIAFIVGAGLLLFIGLAILLTLSIIRPINRVVDFAGSFRLGDLSARLSAGKDEIGKMGTALNAVVESMAAKADIAIAISKGNLQNDVEIASEKDALGHALQSMIHELNEIVSQLNTAAEEVDAGSRQVSDSSQSLSQGATEQASSLEEITSSMTQIGSQTKTNAENAGQANQLAGMARNAVENGVRQMGEMTSAMEAINNSSREISKIIKTIDDIAFQTNLLALNAAVEAARAGKHGKGFAVVAQEVRSLAARSAKAAQETTALIDGAIQKVETGNTITEKTGQALAEINEGVSKVADLVSEIASASNEQAQAIAQVTQGLSQVDSVTQQNTANAEETSSAAEELAAQASHVRSLLKRFQLRQKHEIRSTKKLPAPEKRIEPVSAGQMDGWGEPEAGTPTNRIVHPADAIAMDDEDFGKY